MEFIIIFYISSAVHCTLQFLMHKKWKSEKRRSKNISIARFYFLYTKKFIFQTVSMKMSHSSRHFENKIPTHVFEKITHARLLTSFLKFYIHIQTDNSIEPIPMSKPLYFKIKSAHFMHNFFYIQNDFLLSLKITHPFFKVIEMFLKLFCCMFLLINFFKLKEINKLNKMIDA